MSRKRGAGAMVPNCPNCMGFADDKRARATTFRMLDGLVHAAPDIWIAGRARSFGLGLDAVMEACGDFAFGCELARIADAGEPWREAVAAWTARNTTQPKSKAA